MSLWVDLRSRLQESRVHSTGWDCCTLHSTVHYWWNNGGLSLIIVLMGPPRNVAGIFGDWCVCNHLFFGIVYRPLCPVLGCAAPFGGGTTVGFGARTKRGDMERSDGVKESPYGTKDLAPRRDELCRSEAARASWNEH